MSGNYTVTVTDSNGCSGRDTIEVVVYPLPVLNLGSDTEFCDGNALVLDAQNPGGNYLWNTGAMTQTLEVDSSGTYSVIVTDAFGCSSEDSIKILVHPNPHVDLGGDTGICFGESIVLDAGPDGLNGSYAWNSGAQSRTITLSDSGTYKVVVMNEFGCSAVDSMHLRVVMPPSVNGIRGELRSNGEYHFWAYRPKNVDHYFWDFGDGSTSTLEDPTHTYPNADGDYWVTLVVSNECFSDTIRAEVRYLITGIDQITLLENNLDIYPSPATDVVTLKNRSRHRMEQVAVYNMLGQRVFTQIGNGTDILRLDVRGMASGVYNVKVTFNNGISVIKRFEIVK